MKLLNLFLCISIGICWILVEKDPKKIKEFNPFKRPIYAKVRMSEVSRS